MILVVAIVISGFLLIGFFLLTLAEARSGTRILAPLRGALDREVEHMGGVLRRADVGSLVFHGIRAGCEFLVRTLVHGVLFLVRFMERLLTRVARALRTRDEMLLSSRAFLSSWISRAKRRFSKKEDDLVE
ncbi:MAG: hypothetical protein WBK28_03135 [Minisyncoccia bacterium]